ncbi:MAG TPA: vWA domain-containing protein, partial [Leptospiraceae bacterium]|nr:vWA domain-containing protein [Leptospiraceae bacterium]
MKYSKMISIFGILSIAALMAGCEGKPKKAKILTTTTSILVDEKSGTTASGASVSTSVSSGSYTVTLPTGLSLSGTPGGAFTGITYQGSPLEVSGFVGQIPDYGQTSSSSLGSSLLALLNGQTASTNLNETSIISTNAVAQGTGNTTIYHITVTTDSSTNVTSLSNLILGIIGVNAAGGTVTNLPSPTGTESSSTTFHVVMQVTYSPSCPEIVGIGVSTTPNYSTTEAILSGFLDGTNTSCGTVTKTAKTDSFSGAADPKADFVWVVDNSSSMAQEQTAVSSAASTFFTALSNKRLDYRIGVITTDSSTLRTAGGTAWVTNSTSGGQTAFTSNTAAGTSGSGTESASYFALQGLQNSNITVRSGAKLYFVFVSDEGDNYNGYNGGTSCNTAPTSAPWAPCTGGTSLDTSNNLFTQNSYKIFSIIGLNSSTGQPGTCTGTGGSSVSASNANNG